MHSSPFLQGIGTLTSAIGLLGHSSGLSHFYQTGLFFLNAILRRRIYNMLQVLAKRKFF